ncbi:ParA family protein [Blastomonas sp. AAP53]|uniref:ParA family protein n=1 Tax=Blastomonas sp. AAP53 TaxID=1248760 RepID=UPI0003157B19|nr:ParA family protein [Blastomonas sp. AAP53]
MAAIAVFNPKGGVGKTTLAINLAWEAAAMGNRTLLWDLDGQGDSTDILVDSRQPPRMDATRLMHGIGDIAAHIVPSKVAGLDVLVPEEDMRRTDNWFVHLAQQQRLNRLLLQIKERYDRIIIDCPPGLGDTARRLLLVADLIIVPVIPAPLAVRGLERVRSYVVQNRGRHAPILPVFSMVDRRRSLHKAALRDHPDWPVIPMTSGIEHMTSRKLPVGRIAPASAAAKVFHQLWNGIDAKLCQMRLARAAPGLANLAARDAQAKAGAPLTASPMR